MTLRKYIEAARAAHPKAFAKIKSERIEAMMAATLAELGRRIDDLQQGKVEIGGIGQFLVRQVKPAKPEGGDDKPRRRVTFRHARPKLGDLARRVQERAGSAED